MTLPIQIFPSGFTGATLSPYTKSPACNPRAEWPKQWTTSYDNYFTALDVDPANGYILAGINTVDLSFTWVNSIYLKAHIQLLNNLGDNIWAYEITKLGPTVWGVTVSDAIFGEDGFIYSLLVY